MNQTPKLIFRKMNFVTTKHMKPFSFPENSIFSGNDFTQTKHSLSVKLTEKFRQIDAIALEEFVVSLKL